MLMGLIWVSLPLFIWRTRACPTSLLSWDQVWLCEGLACRTLELIDHHVTCLQLWVISWSSLCGHLVTCVSHPRSTSTMTTMRFWAQAYFSKDTCQGWKNWPKECGFMSLRLLLNIPTMPLRALSWCWRACLFIHNLLWTVDVFIWFKLKVIQR